MFRGGADAVIQILMILKILVAVVDLGEKEELFFGNLITLTLVEDRSQHRLIF